MRSLKSLAAVGVIAAGLAGCGGTQTITVNISASGGGQTIAMSMVASGDSSGIARAKSQLNQQLAGGASGATVNIVDGDQHQGKQVCETDVTDSSGTYHVIVYSDSAVVTPDICTSIKSASTS